VLSGLALFRSQIKRESA